MDQRFQQRNRDDRFRYSGGYARGVIARAQAEGNGQFKNKMSSSKTASESKIAYGSSVEVHLETKQNSTKKGSGTPIKTLIREEMSKEKKISQHQPSVIARLMGLDSLPPPCIEAEQKKEIKSYLPKMTYNSYHDHSLGKNTKERKECKDVFEIKDSTKVEKHKKKPVTKEDNPLTKQNDIDIAFVRQSFIEAKHLSTNENFQNSKEFNDALEVLDSNRGIFLKFLEEPNSLSANNLHDVKGFPLAAPHESHIKVLKPSKAKTCDTEICTQMHKNPMRSSQKPSTYLFNHLFHEHSDPLSHKLLKAQKSRKTSTSHRSTNIVVLKPNLEKTHDMVKTISQPSSHEGYIFGYKRSKEFQYSGIQELHAEGKERHDLLDSGEVLGQRTKKSREIAREIANQMKHSVKTGSGFNRHDNIKDERLHAFPSLYNSNNLHQHTQNNFDYWNNSSRPSTSYSKKLHLSEEARKRLFERWRMSNRLYHTKQSDKGSSTLGEMLNESDKEVPKVFDCKGQLYPSGISSKNGWKDEYSIGIPRSSPPTSKSNKKLNSEGASWHMLKDVLNLGVVASSSLNLNSKQCSSKRSKVRSYKSHFNPVGLENKLPNREICMNQEEVRNEIRVSDQYEVTPMLSRPSESDIANSFNVVDSSSVKESIILNSPLIDSAEHNQQLAKELEVSAIDHTDEVIEENSPEHPQVYNASSKCEEIESESVINSDNADNPSPISVFECLSQDGESSPECFDKVSADLQELRMQLHLLRLESNEYNSESETAASSEDGSTQKCNFSLYKNEEDRDYLYVIDTLSLFNVHSSQNDLSDLDSFKKLEEKYAKITEWSKSERKLLFDLISSIVEDILSRKRKLGSVCDSETLNDEVWQMVVTVRKELVRGKLEKNILDPKWLDLELGVDIIAREIEKMMMDEFLEEFVFEHIVNSF